jgi:hypothetical protein
MATKTSFGNGYGLNRGMAGEKHLSTAIPPHAHVTVKPGVGKAHHKNVNFSAKIYRRTPK